jgi:superfamily I DNA and/or RNA helicase
MSPLAVADYIPRNTLEFDLVIIDEASQMTPENAIGALMRAKKVMVVGDVNQLPPSNFFRKMLEDEGQNEDEIITETSILEMASAVFYPRRRLRWHYRSRHPGLIAFSNKYIYDNDLVVFPSTNEKNPEMGVNFIKVNGLYSTGDNPEEAKVMIDAIVEFMIKYPNKSLGVVVLNQKQASLLSSEMDYAYDKHPLALKYKEKWQKQEKQKREI